MLSVHPGQSAAQPCSGHVVQVGSNSVKVEIVLPADVRCLVQELDLGSEVRNARRVVSDCEVERLSNTSLAPEYPLIVVGIVKHQFQDPLPCVRGPAP